MISCFSYHDYRQYLTERLPVSGEMRGQRSKLAGALGVQTAFVSRVLHGEAHFSLEHGAAINRFLGHTDMESEYFLLLLQISRAGTEELRQFFQKQLEKIEEQRKVIADRIQVKKELSAEDQMTYYSSWHYSAIHILLLVPKWQTVEAISEHLQLPTKKVSEVLEFLVGLGLATQEGERYKNGTNRIHLGKNSPSLPRHHANWRLQGMLAVDKKDPEDLFFSGPICLSEADAKRLREMLIKFLEASEKIIGPSPEETVYCLGIDYFRV